MQLGRVGGQTVPGESPEWTFVVGRGFLVVVPVSTPTPVVAALHGLAAESVVPIEDLVAVIPLGGLDDVDSFAVIVPGLRPETAPATGGPPHDGIPVHALVRGALAVDVFSIGGSRRFTDRNIRPWLLAEFQAVTGLVIGSPLASVARSHQLGAGRVLGEGIDVGDTLFWSVAGRGAGAADTVLRPRRIVDDTVLLTRTGNSDERRAAAPLGGGEGDPTATHDRTVDSSTDPDAASPGPCGFRLASGREVRLDRVYRIGRNPRTRRIQVGEILELVTVDSPNALVSGNHLEIRQTGTAVVLTDLGSTNGTLVRFALGRTQRLRSGASLTVLPGTTVDIGDGNLIEILPAG